MTDKTIAELVGIDQHDPWDRRSDDRKEIDARRKVMIEAALAARDAAGKAPFVDPPIDDSLAFKGRGSYFARLKIPGHPLSEIIALEPSVRDVAIVMRNHTEGGWFIVNSRRVAQRLTISLCEKGFPVQLESVDETGNLWKPPARDDDEIA